MSSAARLAITVALRAARRDSATSQPSAFERGYSLAQLNTIESWLSPDPAEMQSAANEVRFLCYAYHEDRS